MLIIPVKPLSFLIALDQSDEAIKRSKSDDNPRSLAIEIRIRKGYRALIEQDHLIESRTQSDDSMRSQSNYPQRLNRSFLSFDMSADMLILFLMWITLTNG